MPCLNAAKDLELLLGGLGSKMLSRIELRNFLWLYSRNPVRNVFCGYVECVDAMLLALPYIVQTTLLVVTLTPTAQYD